MTKKDIIKELVESFDLDKAELKKLKLDQLNELKEKLNNPNYELVEEINDDIDNNDEEEDEIVIDIRDLSKSEYRFFLQTGQLPKRFIN